MFREGLKVTAPLIVVENGPARRAKDLAVRFEVDLFYPLHESIPLWTADAQHSN